MNVAKGLAEGPVKIGLKPEATPPSGDQQIADQLFAQRVSYDSGIPMRGILALTNRISELEHRIRILELQGLSQHPNAEFR